MPGTVAHKLAENWRNLPYHVFGDIVTMGGLQKCRQVCQSWNEMVSKMTKYDKNPIRRSVESLAAQIRKEWVVPHKPFLHKITAAASLAYHEILGSVMDMDLDDVDLASVPVEHLSSLASCVTRRVNIINVSNCDFDDIFDSVKCEELNIGRLTLTTEETQALVLSMESRVKVVELGYDGEVSLDITALTQYSGEGRCGWVGYYHDTKERYKEEMRTWVQRTNWLMEGEEDLFNVIRN